MQTTFEYPSSNKPGVSYTVTVDLLGRMTCNCPGFNNRANCTHVRQTTLKLDSPDARAQIGMVGFIDPMLASPSNDRLVIDPHIWFAEIKYDGHRLITRVQDGTVGAWSRDGNPRPLPEGIANALGRLPNGTYDGELLVPGMDSSAVTEKKNWLKLTYVIFDILLSHPSGTEATNLMDVAYTHRRTVLTTIFERVQSLAPQVLLSESTRVSSNDHVQRLCDAVWKKGGEGLILKRFDSKYLPGKRSKEWVKFKQLHSAVVTVVGYEAGKNGPYAKVKVLNDAGKASTVKTLDYESMRKFAVAPLDFIGRKLRVDYQSLTEDGNYRHPRWDRWEDE